MQILPFHTQGKDPGDASEPRKPSGVVHTISIVVPVYQGEQTLAALVKEIEPLSHTRRTPGGHSYRVAELILVHDGAIDNSDQVMEALASRHAFVSLVWLSRNFGQHPATLAGMASTTSEWIVTIDEDGQQDPMDIGRMLDVALAGGAQLVYAQPTNQPPHGWLRNQLSRIAKWIFVTFLSTPAMERFNSFRLIQGEIGRSLAAYCGSNVYLDSALCWVVAQCARCPVQLRGEDRPSGYNYIKLIHHFWRLVMTSGTKPLRLISTLGFVAILFSVAMGSYVLYHHLTFGTVVQGWSSMILVNLFFFGFILLCLGVIAEYLGTTLTMTMGKPLYVVVSRPSSRKKVA